MFVKRSPGCSERHSEVQHSQLHMAALRDSGSVDALRAQIAILRDIVAEQRTTIEQLRGACEAGPARQTARVQLAAPRRAALPIDIVLGSWSETGSVRYAEFMNVAQTCTTWRRRVLFYLRILRTLDMRCELNVPPVRTAADQRRHQWRMLYEQRFAAFLQAAGGALDRMGSNLKELHLRRETCFSCSSEAPTRARDVVMRLERLVKRTPTLALHSLTWSLGILSLASLEPPILHRVLGNLRRLDLSGNLLGDDGCRQLACVLLGPKALAKRLGHVLAARLEQLDVSNNCIRETGFG